MKYCFLGNDPRFKYLDILLKDCPLDIDELTIAAPREDTSLITGNVIGGKGYHYSDTFTTKNSKITAENTLPLIIENTSKTIYELNMLILGYGFLGKALYNLLSSLGANVTVASRREGLSLETSFSNTYDVILNTIPAPVLDNHQSDNLTEICYIELASVPGFTKNIWNMKVIDGKALPGRFAPESAAKILYEEILLGGNYGFKG